MKNSQQIRLEKQSMLSRWKSSGQSIVSFCKSEGIAYHSFFYWQKKLSESSSSVQSKFIELPSLPPSSLPLTELIYPNGKRIVFHSLPEVSVLKQLTE